MEPASPAVGEFYTTEPPGKSLNEKKEENAYWVSAMLLVKKTLTYKPANPDPPLSSYIT